MSWGHPADAGAQEEDLLKSGMKSRLGTLSIGRVLLPAIIGLAFGAGCAHQQKQQSNDLQQQRIEKLKSRLEEVERTNGRLNVRIEELEDQVFLLQDRTESNRIALKRRGYMRGSTGQAPRAEAPQPTPESYYYQGEGNPYGAQGQNRRGSQRPVTRIPLNRGQTRQMPEQGGSQQREAPQQRQRRARADRGRQAEQSNSAGDSSSGEGEIVITEKEFEEFAGSSDSNRQRSNDSSGRSEKKAQPPVTDEKLDTSDKKDSKVAKPTVGDNPLDTYKTWLAKYWAGNYAQALAGFTAFIEADPKVDYVDNALYWIGE